MRCTSTGCGVLDLAAIPEASSTEGSDIHCVCSGPPPTDTTTLIQDAIWAFDYVQVSLDYSFSEGRGFVAATNIRKGERLLNIPEDLVVTPDAALQCSAVGGLLEQTGQPAWSVLAVLLAETRCQGPLPTTSGAPTLRRCRPTQAASWSGHRPRWETTTLSWQC